MEHHPQASHYESNPFRLIQPSFEAFKLCWKPLLLWFLIIFGVIIVAIALVAIVFSVSPPLGILLGLIVGLASFYGIYGVAWACTKILLEAARGHRMGLKESWPADSTMPLKLFLTVLLAGLAFLGGLFLLIIPGIIFLGWFMQSIYVVVDEGIWGVAALKRSKKLAKGRVPEVLGVFLLVSSLVVLNFVPIVGSLIALGLALILSPLNALRYDSLIALKSRPHWDKTPISGWNYAVIVVGLVALGYANAHNPYRLNQPNPPSLLENNGQPY